MDFGESTGESPFRKQLEEIAAEKGADYLHQMLADRDEKAAAEIHPNNLKRVIRALEYYEETGQPISVHNETQKEKESPFCYAYFVLNDEREKLYRQIDHRVDMMIEAGLVEEVRGLYSRGLTEAHVSMKGLGYKELFPYFRGEITLEEAVRVIKRDTRHFAKRQITWFKREKDVIWLNKPDFSYDEHAILDYMLSRWQEKLREEEHRI